MDKNLLQWPKSSACRKSMWSLGGDLTTWDSASVCMLTFTLWSLDLDLPKNRWSTAESEENTWKQQFVNRAAVEPLLLELRDLWGLTGLMLDYCSFCSTFQCLSVVCHKCRNSHPHQTFITHRPANRQETLGVFSRILARFLANSTLSDFCSYLHKKRVYEQT